MKAKPRSNSISHHIMNVEWHLLNNLWLFPHTSLAFQHCRLPSCLWPKLKLRVIHQQINSGLHFISHWKEFLKTTSDFHINHGSLLFLDVLVCACTCDSFRIAPQRCIIGILYDSSTAGVPQCYVRKCKVLCPPPQQRHIKSVWRIFEMERGKRLRERFSTAMNFNKERHGTISTTPQSISN